MNATFALRIVSALLGGLALGKLFHGSSVGASLALLLAAALFVVSTMPGKVWWTSSGLPLAKRGGGAILAHLARHPSPWLQGFFFLATIVLWGNAFLEREAGLCFDIGIITCLIAIELCLYYHRLEKRVHGALLKHWERTWLGISLLVGVVMYLKGYDGSGLVYAAISASLALITCIKGAWSKIGGGYLYLVTGKQGWDVACFTVALSSLTVSILFGKLFEGSEHLETISGMELLFPALLLAIGTFIAGALLFIQRLSKGDTKPPSTSP